MSAAPHPMSCREMAESLSDYLDGDLASELKTLIDDHRGDCPPCEAFIRTLARAVETIRALPRAPLPAGQVRALAEALRASARTPRS